MIKLIDVSHYQNKIDWKKVKKTGITCAILKCTEGIKYKDPTFELNRKEARKNGILVGAYHFCRGFNVDMEANWFIKSLGEIQEGEFIALDFEVEMDYPTNWCGLWLDTVTAKTKLRPFMYMNSSTVVRYDWEVISKEFGLWVARYGTNDGTQQVKPATGKWNTWAIWQYTSRGKVDGIIGNVDVNVFNGTLTQLKKYGKPPVSSKIDSGEAKPPKVVQTDTTPKQDETVSIPVLVHTTLPDNSTANPITGGSWTVEEYKKELISKLNIMEQLLQMFKSRTIILAVLQGTLGVIIAVETQYPTGGTLLIVKSIIDILLRFYTTKPVDTL